MDEDTGGADRGWKRNECISHSIDPGVPYLSNRQSDRGSDFQPGIPNAVSETSQDGGRAVGNSGVRICAGTERIQTGKQASGSETSGRDQRVERPDASVGKTDGKDG